MAQLMLAVAPLWVAGLLTLSAASPGRAAPRALLVFAGLAVLAGWVGPHLPLGQAWLPACLTWGGVIAYLLAREVGDWHHLVDGVARKVAWTGGLAALVVAIGSLSTQTVLQILGWGHDNSAHYVLVRADAACGGFLFACSDASSRVPAYLVEYPQGTAVAWMTFPGAFTGQVPASSLAAFLLIEALTSVAVVGVSLMLVRAFLPAARRWQVAVASSAALITIVFGVWSHQFWSGFPTFLWCLLILLAFVTLREGKTGGSPAVIGGLATAALVVSYYSYQLIFPLVAGYILVDAFAHRRYLAQLSRAQRWQLIAWAGVAVLLLAAAPRSAQGNSFIDQLVAEGGMEAIPLWVLIPTAAIAALLFMSRTTRDHTALRWTMIFGLAMFAATSAVTLKRLGYVSYYPMKIAYVLLIFFIIQASVVLVTKPIRTTASWMWFTAAAAAALGLALLPPFLRSPGFKTPYQGSTISAVRTLATDPYGGGVALCAPLVMEAVTSIKDPSAYAMVYADGLQRPVETRWVNLLRGHWDTGAWKAEGFGLTPADIPASLQPTVSISHDAPIDMPAASGQLTLTDVAARCSATPLPAVIPIG